MLKFLKNDNKKKSLSIDENNDVCTIEEAEKFICDNNDSDYALTHKKKLHRNLLEILNDKTTLSFFIQYLESKNGLPLIKFWLDVEAFKAAGDSTSSCERTESRTSNYESIKRDKRRRSDECDYDCVSISTTSASNFDETDEFQTNTEDDVDNHARESDIVFDIERMTQSLTDDEKSKLCEQNRKKDETNVDELKKDESETKSTEEVVSRKYQPMILEDALRIYRKYLVTDSTYSIELPATILAKLSLALCGNDMDSEVDFNNLWQAFDEAQKHIFDIMEREYLLEFLESSFYFKYTIDVLTSESLCLAEILYSESALFYFMEFLEQDKNSKLPYLEFWLSATNFRKHLEQESEELNQSQLKSDALVIYEKWFSLQATTPLNFSNQVRMKVEELICSSSVLSCFDIPCFIVEVFLERNCFKKFMKSQLFYKHLSEVMSKIDTNDHNSLNSTSGIIRRNSSYAMKFPTKNKHRRTNSETFDRKEMTRSISAQNTLLAGLDYKRNRNSADLQIDSRQLADPDLLWRRQNSTSKLSFGRVDQYGRYERDFEMPSSISSSKSFQQIQLQNNSIDVDDPQSIFEQAKWCTAQNRLKNAMRKLVHLPEDSVQQEIAWQVAELIVKDVTSITLQNENPNNS